MITASVAELQAALSTYLVRVQAGEHVVVTDGGEEIARLVPSQRPDPAASGYADLVARGLIIPARQRASADDLLALPRIADPDGLLLKALLAEREEGR